MNSPEARLALEARTGRLVGTVDPGISSLVVTVVAPWLCGCSRPGHEEVAPRALACTIAHLLMPAKTSCFEEACWNRPPHRGGSHRHGCENRRGSTLGWTCDPRNPEDRGPIPWDFRGATERDSGTSCPSDGRAPGRRSSRDPMPKDPCPRSRLSPCAHRHTQSLWHPSADCTWRKTPRTRARASALHGSPGSGG